VSDWAQHLQHGRNGELPAWIWKCPRRAHAELVEKTKDAKPRQWRRLAGCGEGACGNIAGKYPRRRLIDNVGRILRVIFVSGQFDKPHSAGGVGVGDIDTPEQRAVARKAATESIVLLKNLLKNGGDLLPLDAAKITHWW